MEKQQGSLQANEHTQQRLIGDLRLVIENAEALLKNTDQYTSLIYQSARAKLALALSAATEELARSEDDQLERMLAAAQANALRETKASGEERVMRAFK